MRVDLLPAGQWEEVNLKARELMRGSVDGEYDVRCYHGMAQALLEVFSGTATFLSHKRGLAFVGGQTWAQEAVLPQLLRENFELKNFTADDLKNPEALVDSIDSETSCFLWPEDHPVTAELFDSEKIDELLAKKRIFSIRMSHHAFRTRRWKSSNYGLRLCSISPNLTVAVTGARFKTPAWLAGFESWNLSEVESLIARAFAGAQEDQTLVQEFERGLKPAWQPIVTSSSRVWDRAVIASSEISGDRALQELSALTKKPFSIPGEPGWIETLHLCRWAGTMRSFDWWKAAPKPDLVRGSLLLDLEALRLPEVRKYFHGAS